MGGDLEWNEGRVRVLLGLLGLPVLRFCWVCGFAGSSFFRSCERTKQESTPAVTKVKAGKSYIPAVFCDYIFFSAAIC